MKSKLYCIRDQKIGAFAQPFPGETEGAVLRGLKAAIDGGQGDIAKYPTDFDLYELGEFDPETGVITSNAIPRHVTNGGVFVEMKKLANQQDNVQSISQ